MFLLTKWFFTKRLICHIKGCDIENGYEEHYLTETWCNRCGNYFNHTNMQIEEYEENLFIERN